MSNLSSGRKVLVYTDILQGLRDNCWETELFGLQDRATGLRQTTWAS